MHDITTGYHRMLVATSGAAVSIICDRRQDYTLTWHYCLCRSMAIVLALVQSALMTVDIVSLRTAISNQLMGWLRSLSNGGKQFKFRPGIMLSHIAAAGHILQ